MPSGIAGACGRRHGTSTLARHPVEPWAARALRRSGRRGPFPPFRKIGDDVAVPAKYERGRERHGPHEEEIVRLLPIVRSGRGIPRARHAVRTSRACPHSEKFVAMAPTATRSRSGAEEVGRMPLATPAVVVEPAEHGGGSIDRIARPGTAKRERAALGRVPDFYGAVRKARGWVRRLARSRGSCSVKVWRKANERRDPMGDPFQVDQYEKLPGGPETVIVRREGKSGAVL